MDNSEKQHAKDFSTLFEEIKDNLVSYVNHRLAHYRLDLLEKTSKSSSLIGFWVILAFVGFAAFAFALIGIALLIGEKLGSTAYGFGIVALFWLILLILVILFREPIKDFILNKVAGQLHKIEKEVEGEEE